MKPRAANPHFMNGVPELLILSLLERNEMYGYEIVQAIRTSTNAVVAAGEGVVYPVLHALEAEGAIRSRRRTVNGRSRIYYSATRAGARRLSGLSRQWMQLAQAVEHMLKGESHGASFPEPA
jgi:PadR family transcriptional regulator PadR